MVEQPIRNRQAASSTLALGSKICWVQPDLRGREFRPFSNGAMESKAGPFLASGEDQAMNLSMAYL